MADPQPSCWTTPPRGSSTTCSLTSASPIHNRQPTSLCRYAGPRNPCQRSCSGERSEDSSTASPTPTASAARSRRRSRPSRDRCPNAMPNGNIIVGGRPAEMTPNDVSPRWVGSGWTIFNNKGKPVRQYEPFFTDTHRFEFDVRIGVSPVLFYDPVERVVATLAPQPHLGEGGLRSVAAGDLGRQRHRAGRRSQDRPRRRRFLPPPAGRRLPADLARPARAAARSAPQEQAAAAQSRRSTPNTPTVAHLDSLGRTFLTVAHNRFKYSDTPTAIRPSRSSTAPASSSTSKATSARSIDAIDRVVMRYDYDMLGNRIHQASMEAGERWMLNDVAGKPLYAWDSRDHQFRTAYDPLRRPDRLLPARRRRAGVAGRSAPSMAKRSPTRRPATCAGKSFSSSTRRASSPATTTTSKATCCAASASSPASTRRRWTGRPPCRWKRQTYTSRTRYDALNRPTELTAPDNSVIRPSYNEANLLERVEANLRGAANAPTRRSSPTSTTTPRASAR